MPSLLVSAWVNGHSRWARIVQKEYTIPEYSLIQRYCTFNETLLAYADPAHCSPAWLARRAQYGSYGGQTAGKGPTHLAGTPGPSGRSDSNNAGAPGAPRARARCTDYDDGWPVVARDCGAPSRA